MSGVSSNQVAPDGTNSSLQGLPLKPPESPSMPLAPLKPKANLPPIEKQAKEAGEKRLSLEVSPPPAPPSVLSPVPEHPPNKEPNQEELLQARHEKTTNWSTPGASFVTGVKGSQAWQELASEMITRTGQDKLLQVDDADESSSFGDKISYSAENALSTNPMMKILWLFIFSTLVILVSGLLYTVVNANCLAIYGEDNEDVPCSPYGKLDGGDAFFTAWMFIAAGGGAEEAVEYGERIVVSFMLIAGMFTFAILVGFITDGITSKMEEMSSGTTKVIEKNHTLLLGWNNSTVRLVVQLALARRDWMMLNRRWDRRLFPWRRLRPSNNVCGGTIVILADNRTKEEMDNALRFALAGAAIEPWCTQVGTGIVCRVGDPTSVHDLLRVAAPKASTIAVMVTVADQMEEDDNSGGHVYNGSTVRSLLAIRQIQGKALKAQQANAKTKASSPNLHVVVQLSAPSLYVSAACWTGPNNCELVHPLFIKEKLNALLFTCAIQKGLSEVLMEMLSFESAELKIQTVKAVRPELIGKSAREAVYAFKNAVVCGLKRMQPNKAGKYIVMNPGEEETILETDSLIFLAEQNYTIKFTEKIDTSAAALDGIIKKEGMSRSVSCNPTQSRVLICGWREEWIDHELFQARISDLQAITPTGTEMTFLNLLTHEEFRELFYVDREGKEVIRDGWKPVPYKVVAPDGSIENPPAFTNGTMELRHAHGDAADPSDMAPLMQAQCFNTAIVLGTQKDVDVSTRTRDSRVLAVLLLLRHLKAQLPGIEGMHIVGEIAEDETSALAALPDPKSMDLASPPDFVNANSLVARCIAQVLACPDMDAIWTELLSSNGSEIYIKPAYEFLQSGKEVYFWQVIAAVRQLGKPSDVCLGYKSADGKLVLAPDMSSKHAFTGKEKIVIMMQ